MVVLAVVRRRIVFLGFLALTLFTCMSSNILSRYVALGIVWIHASSLEYLHSFSSQILLTRRVLRQKTHRKVTYEAKQLKID